MATDSTSSGEPTFEAAVALHRAGRLEEAIAAYRRLAEIRPSVSGARNLGLALQTLGRQAQAVPWLELAVHNRPAEPELRQYLGNAYAALGEIDRAEQQYRTGLSASHGHGALELALAALYLSVGRYAEGWPLLDARAGLHPDVVPPVNVNFPEWRGEPIAGRSILVCVEQGFGDQIQMSRFANTLKARGAARVTLACRPVLADLFATLAGVDAVVPIGEGTQLAIARHDYWSRYFSLPQHLGITLENLPAEPYLSASADRRTRWAGRKGVGLCWHASPTGFNATHKALPPAMAQRLLDLGAVSLHPEDTGAADFADTAAIIDQLDLVVSIDTSVAHLAGAMGKPCWILLPAINTDWRWLRGRNDSPWYPSLRLYRQTTPGDWSPVIAQILAAWPR